LITVTSWQTKILLLTGGKNKKTSGYGLYHSAWAFGTPAMISKCGRVSQDMSLHFNQMKNT